MDGVYTTRRSKLGPGFRLSVGMLKPLLLASLRRDWHGTEHLAHPGGIILAANHISWFDPLAIAYVAWENDRPPRFLAKEGLFDTPVVGPIIKNAGQIPVYRESKEAVESVRAAIAAVEAGECVVVYPEGTITRDPNLWPMSAKTGAARIALATRAPLLPVAQWGSHEVMRPYRKELHLVPPKTIHVSIGDPIDLTDLYDRPMDAATLKTATDRLMDAITVQLEQLRGEQAPAERMVWQRRKKDQSGGLDQERSDG